MVCAHIYLYKYCTSRETRKRVREGLKEREAKGILKSKHCNGISEIMLLTIALALLIVLLSWGYKAILRPPPPPRICGTPVGPPITPRIKLRDGRHLAYKEYGVPREEAKFKIVFVHGFSGSRHDAVIATNLSPVLKFKLF